MDKYSVRMYPRAYKDLESIYNYILQIIKENEIAKKSLEDIESAIYSLEGFPYRGAERRYGIYANRGYRQLFVRNFNIIYKVEEASKCVMIITVKYSKSDF